jgi:hypothetical protein
MTVGIAVPRWREFLSTASESPQTQSQVRNTMTLQGLNLDKQCRDIIRMEIDLPKL